MYNKTTAAAFVLALSKWPCDQLAALNLGIDWGDVPEANKGYAQGVADGLLMPSGKPVDKDALAAALSVEINKRIEQNTWE